MLNYWDLPFHGLDADLSPEEEAILDSVHKFAENVMRPIGAELDVLKPEEVIAEGSRYWEAFAKFAELGISIELLDELEPAVSARLSSMLFETLGWGDAGLAIALAAAMLPHMVVHNSGREDLKALTEGKLGCWAITEPDHGSDSLDSKGSIAHPNAKHSAPNVVATLLDDKVVINGQKSAWVSNGPTAQVCVLFCHAKQGDAAKAGPGAVVIVPMDAEGVSRGAPLDKLGQRALPQGEVFFDNVELPIANVVAGPEAYNDTVYGILTEANALMSAVFSGVSRAAFEHAFEYAKERRQGGAPIIEHQSVQARLFEMYRKLEISRAISRRAMSFNALAPVPALQGSIASKVTSTQHSFEVAHDALGIFGGYGLTKEYPMEKILRDARASMIEDGCNHILALKGLSLLKG